ncbi:hypothetical protein KY347_04735 [Candidatus Woesearchaeota archaeon]|nr:hypothetical protein [Candidatus Woesearchaeota archaeon]
MDRDEEEWKNQLEKFKVVQKCPKCGELSLKYFEGRIKCTNCGFEQDAKSI